MKFKSVISLLALVVMIIGCEDYSSNQEKTAALNDARLIKAIQESTDKQDINAQDLPSASKTVLESDYSDSYVEDAKMAPRLGYEVGLRNGKSAYQGDIGKAYFNLKGRELRGDKYFDRGGRGGKDGKDRLECFSLVLPVTFFMPDGSPITIENKEDWRKIKNWCEAHPDSKERPALQYPVEVKMEDGTVIALNNDEEMKSLREGCGGREGGDRDREKCFEFVYPITHIMPDGSTITVESKESLADIRNWYADHPDFRERPTLQYPVDVTFEDGTTITINNDEEMRGVHARCDEGRGIDGGGRDGGGGNRP